MRHAIPQRRWLAEAVSTKIAQLCRMPSASPSTTVPKSQAIFAFARVTAAIAHAPWPLALRAAPLNTTSMQLRSVG